jgi:hypothetical protein
VADQLVGLHDAGLGEPVTRVEDAADLFAIPVLLVVPIGHRRDIPLQRCRQPSQRHPQQRHVRQDLTLGHGSAIDIHQRLNSVIVGAVHTPHATTKV